MAYSYSFGYPFFRATDASGVPLVGGKLYSYEAGTSTPLATYAVSDASSTNTNPIILDGNGEAIVWLGNNTYKFVLKDANDVVLWTIDNVNPRVQTVDLQDLAVTTAKLAELAVTAAKLATDAVTEAKILAGAVTEGKIADNSVSTAKIQALAITTAKLADLSVTTPKLAANSVTRAKLESLGQQIASGSSGSYLTTSFTPALVTNQIVSITTTGRPVFLFLIPALGALAIVANGGSGGGLVLQRDSVTIAQWTVGLQPINPPVFLDKDATAGTHEYKLYAYREFDATNIVVFNCALCAFET